MTDIRWDEKYEVGNADIDAEHRVFVSIIQKINRAFEERADRAYLERLLSELLKYAEFHFCSEENRMIEAEYPDIINHNREHEKLLAELRNIIMVFSFGRQMISKSTVTEFLMKWFTTHTIREDRKLADYLKHI